MQTFINFHPKLSVSHVRLDYYGLCIEPAHVLCLAHSECCTDPRSWIASASAAEFTISLGKNEQVSRKPGWDLRDQLSPASSKFPTGNSHLSYMTPDNLGVPPFPMGKIKFSSRSRML